MKDFGQWFKDQKPVGDAAEEDAQVWLECTGCGKSETVNRLALENGDAWALVHWLEDGRGEGLCGGSERCVP